MSRMEISIGPRKGGLVMDGYSGDNAATRGAGVHRDSGHRPKPRTEIILTNSFQLNSAYHRHFVKLINGKRGEAKQLDNSSPTCALCILSFFKAVGKGELTINQTFTVTYYDQFEEAKQKPIQNMQIFTEH